MLEVILRTVWIPVGCQCHHAMTSEHGARLWLYWYNGQYC